ncbi:U4 putative protein [Bangoran virus]|uniref:U4 putative protein n=1 Tax=Bangoran virus TaxID=864693 RepID=UPI002481D59A|nr:U4 putative protein [Bangoran virus]UAX43321.1 U4 putative protein [Bangoran virus]
MSTQQNGRDPAVDRMINNVALHTYMWMEFRGERPNNVQFVIQELKRTFHYRSPCFLDKEIFNLGLLATLIKSRFTFDTEVNRWVLVCVYDGHVKIPTTRVRARWFWDLNMDIHNAYSPMPFRTQTRLRFFMMANNIGHAEDLYQLFQNRVASGLWEFVDGWDSLINNLDLQWLTNH